MTKETIIKAFKRLSDLLGEQEKPMAEEAGAGSNSRTGRRK